MKEQAFLQLEVSEYSDKRDKKLQQHLDCIASEVPIALVFNEISHAVLMATPEDLFEFATGFSFTEGIISHPDEVFDTQIVTSESGIEVQLTIASERFQYLKERRRNLTGRTGCGICGAESLQQIRLPLKPVDSSLTITHEAVNHATAQLTGKQIVQAKTGAVHGAAWCNTNGEICLLYEDVGRHNALDKLIGSLLLQGRLQEEGFLLISSRASYEMVQKAAMANIPIVIAVSAATTLAKELAEEAGVCLIGFSRGNRHVVYSHSERMSQS